MRSILLVLSALLFLPACATGYHSASNPILGIFGGFTHQDGYGKLTKVSFHGNGFITVEKVTEYTVRRSAELAAERKKPYFALYKSIIDAHFEEASSSPNYFSIGGKPSGYAYILFLDQEVKGGFSTEEVLKKLKSQNEGASK